MSKRNQFSSPVAKKKPPKSYATKKMSENFKKLSTPMKSPLLKKK